MKAVWKDTVLAESDDTVVVDGNHYFPESTLNRDYIMPSNLRTTSSQKGTCHYYNLLVDGNANPDAVWFYPDPKEAAENLRGRVAFGHGVRIED